MICKNCGKPILGSERCVCCGLYNKKREIIEDDSLAKTVCLNCGAEISSDELCCTACGLERGMTPRQYKYKDYKENKFLPFALLCGVVFIIIYVAFDNMALAYAYPFMIVGLILSIFSVATAHFDKMNMNGSVLFITVMFLIHIITIIVWLSQRIRVY